MTFDSDFIRLHLNITTADIPCKKVGLEWPPPEQLFLEDDGRFRPARPNDDPEAIMVRRNLSSLPDNVIEGATMVARGAEYFYLVKTECSCNN